VFLFFEAPCGDHPEEAVRVLGTILGLGHFHGALQLFDARRLVHGDSPFLCSAGSAVANG
jgi:hypothetical protein